MTTLLAYTSNIPSIKIQSLTAVAQSFVPVTFGQVFLPGALPAGRGLLARAADGSYASLQVDEKVKHPDGSVFHAILSANFPALVSGETKTFQLVDAEKSTEVLPFLGVAASVVLTVAGAQYTAAPDLAAEHTTWITGPAVTEQRYVVPFVAIDGAAHPHLVARFAVRDYGSSGCRVELVIENCWAYVAAPQNFDCDVAVSVAGLSVYTDSFTHYHHARWRKEFWFALAPQVHVQHDPEYLIACGVAPNYDLATQPYDSVLSTMDIESKPMQIGLATGYMPSTGAHEDIGILPEWVWAWIVSQDHRAEKGTRATADGVGSFPMHYRDEKTDRPISIKNFPHMTLDGHHDDTWNDTTKQYEAFPWVDTGTDAAPKNQVPFVMDDPHQGSYNASMYLLRGEYFDLEEMQFWAGYNALKFNPSYRNFGAGLLKDEQLRGQAWSMRTLFQVAAFSPDGDPLKADFTAMVDSNLDWYNATYTNNPDANPLGAIVNGAALGYDGNSIAPWMDDFFTSAIGYGVGLGFEKAKPLLLWKAKFAVGRMTDPEVCWFDAAIYNLRLRSPEMSVATNGDATVKGGTFSTLRDVWIATRGAEFMNLPCGGPDMALIIEAPGTNEMGNLTGYELGFPSNLQPALAYAVDAGAPAAQIAWDRFMSRRTQPDYRKGGQFNIVPKTYKAQPIAPTFVDPNASLDWQQIATEGQTVTVPANTTVRYGAGEFFTSARVMSGQITVDNNTFGGDPAPNVGKVLQQLIPSTEGNPMTHKLSILSIAFANQDLAFGTEAPTSLLIELLDPAGAVLGSTATVPGDITGITFGDLTAKHTLRLSGLNTAGVMGTPALQDFVPQDYLPVVTAPTDPVPPVDPTPTTAAYSLPSTVTFTLAQE